MRVILTLIALLLSGCALRLEKAEVAVPERYIYAGEETTQAIPSEWWQIYRDPVLDSLQRQALEYNRDLQAAVERVEQARLGIAVARSAFLPQIDIEADGQAEYTTPTQTTQQYVAGAAISWNLSLFGALRNAEREARAELLATQWAMRGVRLSLTEQVATAYFTLRQSEISLAIARRSHRLRSESATLIDSLFRYGMATGLDVDQARSLVYVAAADIEQYTRARNQAHLSLCTLIGSGPQAYSEDDTAASRLEPEPMAVPATLPSQMLQQRPDVMQARYEAEAAAAAVGAARSNRFPSIPLSAKGGRFGTEFKELFSENLWSWSATGALAQPLFSFGRLAKQEKIARSKFNQALREYEQSVLTALQQVESALTAIQTTKGQMERYAEYVEANRRIAELTDELYKVGMSNYLDVISTEQTWYSSQLSLVELMAQQKINYATLVMALGKGWQTQ